MTITIQDPVQYAVWVDLPQCDIRKDARFHPDEEIENLAKSMAVKQLQNIIVCREGDRLEVIVGVGRVLAAKKLGWAKIRADVYEGLTEFQKLEMTFSGNEDRKNASPLYQAQLLKAMQGSGPEELTHEQLAERMGKERSTVANYIRLLKLPPDIQVAVRNNQLSMGHARALINVDTIDKQLYLFNEIKKKGLSVRQTEELVRQLYKENTAVKNSVKPALPEAFKRIEDNLASHFSTRVKLNHNKKGEGSISIEYYSLQELNKLLDQLGVAVN